MNKVNVIKEMKKFRISFNTTASEVFVCRAESIEDALEKLHERKKDIEKTKILYAQDISNRHDVFNEDALSAEAYLDTYQLYGDK